MVVKGRLALRRMLEDSDVSRPDAMMEKDSDTDREIHTLLGSSKGFGSEVLWIWQIWHSFRPLMLVSLSL